MIHRCLLSFFLVLAATLDAVAEQEALTPDEARERLATIEQEITAIKQSLERARSNLRKEQSALRALDLDIQKSALATREVEERIANRRATLRELESDRIDYLASLNEQNQVLEVQIIAAYRMGRESRLKLLLNQDNPARVSRMLAYYDYFSNAQAKQIEFLRETLRTLDQMQSTIEEALQDLGNDLAEQRRIVEELQGRRADRSVMMKSLSSQIDSDAAKLQELTRNQADLQSLVRELTERLADLPTDLGEYKHPRDLKGRLNMPLSGRVIHAFGQARTGGLRWQGCLIAAGPGTEVHSIAYGRVAFADWLRGYGMLMIIDHGDGFMSLYGNNESLLYEAGEWIQPGQAIGTIGSQPAGDQGLYFELRNNGQPVDPSIWVSRK